MSDKEFRMERINKLLQELRHEVERGFMEAEIEERIGFQFIVPVSRELTNGIVMCRFETRPMHKDSVMGHQLSPEPRLKLVE